MCKKKINLWVIVSFIILMNFGLRLLIYFNTELFSFSDYSAYIEGIERIASGEKQFLLSGNFLFAISHIGYFFKYIIGNIDYFFIFNCLLGTLSGLLAYFLVVKVTGSQLAAILTIIIHTLYTEFMVFSSVFYTPVISIFLLSLFLFLLYFYYINHGKLSIILVSTGLIFVFLLTFFFKPELKFLPWFMMVFSVFFILRYKRFAIKTIRLALLLLTSYFLLGYSGFINHPHGNVISNAFVFFGHTDYGGDGGEGSFVYQENRARYEAALAEYCKVKNISNPTISDSNSFQRTEIKNFIIHHPRKWVSLQFTKFFRTFGVVPETTSFKVLYSGLFKENLWLTSIFVVAPLAIIILLFILFFNISSIKQLLNPSTTSNLQPASSKFVFLNMYLLLFIYYIIATVFYGQYQERYRMPLMVVFIIPVLGLFIASFNKKQFLKRTSLLIKSIVIILFLTVWVFQAKNAISNKGRLENAIESIKIVPK
jgi:hypothetical protein